MLLILSSKQDLAADYLLVALHAEGKPAFRINAEDVYQGDLVFAVSAGVVARTIRLGHRSCDLNEVTSVWYRRALSPPPPPSARMTHADSAFVRGEWRHFLEGMVLDSHVKWVSPIDAVARAEHKLFQLNVASALGFRLPDTMVSNKPEILRDFAASHSAGVIVKPIYHGLYCDGTDRYSIYTQDLEPAHLLDTDLPRACPTLLQAKIAKGADLRITVIGSEFFGVEILPRGAPTTDWRASPEDVDYRVLSVPKDIQEKCGAMLGVLGLRFGAFDFVRTPDGEWFFLEVNPTGEWAWLEDRLGLPLRNAFIRLFYS